MLNTESKNYDHLIRQADLIPLTALTTPIHIIGCGAVGSWVAFTLAKMGYEHLFLYDFDTVDVVNMNAQIYGFHHIGRNKAEALGEMITQFTKTQPIIISEKFSNPGVSGIVIAAVDSMEARASIYAMVKETNVLLIDPRMGSELALLFTTKTSNPEERAKYEKSLHSDENGDREPCTAKSTGYCALSLAGLVASQVKNFTTQEFTGVKGNMVKMLSFSIPHSALKAFHH